MKLQWCQFNTAAAYMEVLPQQTIQCFPGSIKVTMYLSSIPSRHFSFLNGPKFYFTEVATAVIAKVYYTHTCVCLGGSIYECLLLSIGFNLLESHPGDHTKPFLEY